MAKHENPLDIKKKCFKKIRVGGKKLGMSGNLNTLFFILGLNTHRIFKRLV